MSERRALVGATALGVVNALKYGLQLMVLPVLARLLEPEAFGIVALAMPFILLAQMLSDAGMGTALAREREPSHELESTVFWLALGVGLTTTLVIAAASAPLAAAFDQPNLAPILATLSIIMTIGSSLSVANARVTRSRRFEIFAVGELIASVLSAAVAITAALNGWGAWSLVASQLTLWIAKALWLWPVTRFVPLPACRPALARSYVAFGLHTVGANIADFGSKNLAPLVIGGALGVTAVGHYTLGWQLNRIPDAIISGPVYMSVFAAVAAAEAGRAELVLRPLRLLVVVLAPVFAGLALVADLIVPIVLGDQWHATAPVLAALAPAGFLLCLFSIASSALLAMGRADRQFRLTVTLGLAVLAGAALGARFGLPGVGLGVSAACLVMAPAYVRALTRELGIRPAQLFAGMAAPIAAAAGMALVVLLVRREIGGLPEAAQLAVAIAAGALAYAAALLALGRRRVLADVRTLLAARHGVAVDGRR
ncbi:MAG TPA: oligosaccharide flippase family protein [Caulobacteraceae bacterium]|nr:oligosaccharide flippase family protein [Caulobacteraceae bacterium]